MKKYFDLSSQLFRQTRALNFYLVTNANFRIRTISVYLANVQTTQFKKDMVMSILTLSSDMIRELTEARLLLEQTVEAREADYQQLQEESAELRQRLDVLESERHAVQAMREHVESQHEALTEGAGPAEKS